MLILHLKILFSMKSSIFKTLSLLVFLSISYFSKSCDTCNTRVAFVNFVTVNYDGVLYDFPQIGQSTWFYTIDNTSP